jgi:DNA primase catalytic core
MQRRQLIPRQALDSAQEDGMHDDVGTMPAQLAEPRSVQSPPPPRREQSQYQARSAAPARQEQAANAPVADVAPLRQQSPADFVGIVGAIGASSAPVAAPPPAPVATQRPVSALGAAPAPASASSGKTLVARIKEALPIENYANEQFKLKKSSGDSGQFVGNCPSHADKTASFYVSPSKGCFVCNGCSFTGNVIHLYAFVNNMEYEDAKMKLGKELNVFNERRLDDGESMVLGAARKYIDQLERKADAMDYLTNVRKLTPESLAKFGIGFCWGREHLNQSDEQKKIAVEMGLLKLATEDRQERSFMAGRITFPVRDRTGRVCGFGGRQVPQTNYKAYGPKYMNSPETSLFKKSELLYGAYESASAIARDGYAVCVEGYVDVVALHQYGCENTVGVMGANANESAFATLWSMTKRAVFCLDGDAAGAAGTLRSVMFAAPTMPNDCRIDVMTLPAGMDPDEFVIANGGQAFRDMCTEATPLSRYLMQQAVPHFDLSYAEGRAAFVGEAKRMGELFANAPSVGAELLAEAHALNAASLAAYALNASGVKSFIEPNVLEAAIAMLQRKLATQVAPVAAAAAASTESSPSPAGAAEFEPELAMVSAEVERPRAARRP